MRPPQYTPTPTQTNSTNPSLPGQITSLSGHRTSLSGPRPSSVGRSSSGYAHVAIPAGTKTGLNGQIMTHVANIQDSQNLTKPHTFRVKNGTVLNKNYQYTTNGIVLSDSNLTESKLGSPQKLYKDMPSSIVEPHPLTSTSAAKSMFEIVVGDVNQLTTKTSEQLFWENGTIDLRQLPGNSGKLVLLKLL